MKSDVKISHSEKHAVNLQFVGLAVVRRPLSSCNATKRRKTGRNFIKIGIDFRIHFVLVNEFEVQEPFCTVEWHNENEKNSAVLGAFGLSH